MPRDVVLHPLPIMGMFYRWFVDLAGPFPPSEYGNDYIMVMIEHFSKWVKVVAIPTKEILRDYQSISLVRTVKVRGTS